MFYNSVAELVGRTPLLKLNRIEAENELKANLFAKLEYFNPAGSSKDRVAKEMIEQLNRDGKLNENTTIIEPTSGNTGIGIAAICASMGIRAIIVMPETMSKERKMLMKAYGAELVLSKGSAMSDAIKKAEELHSEIEGSVIAGQFINPANPEAHKKTTGVEIWEDLDGKADMIVAGVGTGGTITGIAEYIKSKNPDVKIVGVEPETSAVLSGKPAGKHGLQGIGAGFIPEILNTEIIDEIVCVSDDEAYGASRELAKKEGILVGISSGAALFAAKKLAKRPENSGKNIVVILPDTGERYLSTTLFEIGE